jgi:hypothetical protein
MTSTGQSLFLALLHADTEAEVLQTLKDAKYWTNQDAWRPIGDNSNNRAIIGNQQEDAVSALAEKITNSVDAILINRCLELGVDPTSDMAPRSMRQALARFFLSTEDESAGMSRFWGSDRLETNSELERVTKMIWLSVTGGERDPSITIVDKGEGQTPDSFPKTFMALVGFRNSEGKIESQKANIPFVQGQFNMGSSGVYPFSSREYGFQLLVSRRNPKILKDTHSKRDEEWGFTVVRRSRTHAKGSIYEYLAPLKTSAHQYGDVLSFKADQLPLIPESPPTAVPNKVYHEMIEYGTLLKLYEFRYKEQGLSTGHVLMKSGLMRQLELVLPECGLPVRIVEGRPPKSASAKRKPGSYQNNMFGILRRVQKLVHRQAWNVQEGGEDDDSIEEDDIEGTDSGAAKKPEGLGLEGPPVDGDILVAGVRIPWVAFVFSNDAGDRTRNGKYSLIYHLNGQKHAHEPKGWFSDIGYRYLARHNQILVLVDCTALTIGQREEVFKPSRDRMNRGELSNEIQDVLKDALKTDSKLQALQIAVHQRKQNERLTSKKPIRNVLESLLKSTPSLARFFGLGAALRITRPFPGADVGGDEGPGTFEGKQHPTFLKFSNGSTSFNRVAHIGSRVRLSFITDAVDDYFSRPRDNGVLDVAPTNVAISISGSRGELESGSFAYNVTLPEDIQVGTAIQIEFTLHDGVIEPLKCSVVLTVQEAQEKRPPGDTPTRQKRGAANINDLDVRKCTNPHQPREGYEQWPNELWSERDAVVIEDNPGSEGAVTFYVNCDNLYLRAAQKEKVEGDAALVEAKFMWSLVLLSLSIIEDFKTTQDSQNEEDPTSEDRLTKRDEVVASTTRAMAQLVLPMMEAVGAMTSDVLDGEE